MVFCDNLVDTVQVGDAACDSSHALQSPTTQPTGLEFTPQHGASGRRERGRNIELIDGECRVDGALPCHGGGTSESNPMAHHR